HCWVWHSARRDKMLKSKTFLKKTRAGGVMKIVREHYLRDDIGCGAAGCTASLEPQPQDPASSLCPQPHYLLPDTNVLLHQVRGLTNRGHCGPTGTRG
ncbi:exosome catalytic subunit dis3, partial [Saguinus oedipus]